MSLCQQRSIYSKLWFFQLSCMDVRSEVKWSESRLVLSNSLWLHSPWNSPGQNTGVGSLSLLQVIFPTQGLNPGLPHWGWILYQLSHKGRLRILEWGAYPFSSESSQPRDRTQVSHIVGRFFTSWATREDEEYWSGEPIPSPVDLSDSKIEPGSPAFQVDSLPTELWGKPKKKWANMQNANIRNKRGAITIKII